MPICRAVRIAVCTLALSLVTPSVCFPNSPGLLSFVDTISGPGSAVYQRLVISPDGKNLYAVDPDTDTIVSFVLDPVTGNLSSAQTYVDGQNGIDGLRDINGFVVAPDGKHVYITALTDDALTIFDRDSGDGSLTYNSTIFNGAGGITTLDQPLGLHISPDGNFVYVASPRDPDSVTVFSRDPMSGQLSLVQTLFAGSGELAPLARVRMLAITPDGAHAYVSSNNGTVLILTRDAATGLLSASVPSATTITDDYMFSSDGLNVYTKSDNAMQGFSRDPATGILTPIQFVWGPTSPEIEALTGITDAVLANDEVYVTSNRALLTFSRSPVDGSLAYIRPHFSSPDGPLPQLFTHPNAVAATPDGRFVYISRSSATPHLALFERKVCPTVPASCKAPILAGKAKLKLSDRDGSAKDQFKWAWKRGTETSDLELGEPKVAAGYLLCLYDESAAEQPVLVARLPGDGLCLGSSPEKPVECWRGGTSNPAKFNYFDRTGLTPDGIAKASFKAGIDSKAQLKLNGRGGARGLLQLPQLPLTGVVRVQLHGVGTGACWGADYATPKRNDAALYSAKSD